MKYMNKFAKGMFLHQIWFLFSFQKYIKDYFIWTNALHALFCMSHPSGERRVAQCKTALASDSEVKIAQIRDLIEVKVFMI